MTAKIKLNAASGGGSFSLQAPSSSANNRVFTLPDVADGTIATTATSGKLLQVVQTVKTDVFSESVTEGTVSGDVTGLTVSITPSSASNKILLDVRAVASIDGTIGLYGYLYKDGSLISGAIGDASGSLKRVSTMTNGGTQLRIDHINTMFLDTAGGTSAINYSIRISSSYSPSSPSARTVYVNRAGDSDETASNQVFARSISTITAMEVAA